VANRPRVGIDARIGRADAILVGQKKEAVRLELNGQRRGHRVVVGDGGPAGVDGVVAVEDRHRARPPEGLHDRCGAAPRLDVEVVEEDLGGDEADRGEGLAPRFEHQRLPERRCGGRLEGRAEGLAAGVNRARREQGHAVPLGGQGANLPGEVPKGRVAGVHG
jgi:hypothetical protein